MSKFLHKKLLITIIALIFTVSIFSIQQTLAYDPSKSWPSQATGCNPIQGNIDQMLNDVYLGAGNTPPQYILNQDPNANSQYLPAWKADMTGMVVGQFKSFIIPASQAYPPSSTDPIGGKDLFFEVTIVNILVGGSPTTSNSVIDLTYSLYTDCQVQNSYPIQTGSVSSTTSTTSDTSTTKAASPNYTGIILGGGLVGAIILSSVGFIIYNGRKPNLNTDKIISKTRTKETQSIRSLKDSLSSDTVVKANTQSKKAPPSRRRR